MCMQLHNNKMTEVFENFIRISANPNIYLLYSDHFFHQPSLHSIEPWKRTAKKVFGVQFSTF